MFKIKCTPVVLVMGVILSSVFFLSAGFATAEETSKQLQYSLNMSLEDNLRLIKGKSVNVTLDSGSTFSGIVKEVKNGLLHLEKITGKSFYDALIRTKNISAIDAQVRGLR